MDVKALTFDVFGTVVDWRGGIAREVAALGGGRGFVKLDVLHRENLDQVLTEFDLGHLDEADRVHLNLAWHRLDPCPMWSRA